jgi:hypothetical protein
MKTKRALTVAAAILCLGPACRGSDAGPERSASKGPGACGRWDPLVDVGPIGDDDADVDEVSGLVESRRHPGVLWGILDNGNPTTLYAFGEDGRTLGRFELPRHDADGAPIENVDWEDVAIGPYAGDADAVWIADVGAYPVERTTVDLYRIREPEIDADAGDVGTVSLDPADVARVTARYPTGVEVRNAEGFFVDPVSGDGFIVSKGLVPGTDRVSIWRAPAAELQAESPFELEDVAEVVGRVDRDVFFGPTAADISPDGDWIATKRLDEVFMWHRSGTVEETFRSMPDATCVGEGGSGGVPDADDGESFAFDIDEGAIAGAWSTLDSPDDPNPPLHRSVCNPCP